MATGWTWDYTMAELDMPRLAAMSEYWRSNPPVHVMVARYLGVKPAPERSSNPDQDMGQLLSMLQVIE